MKTPNYPNPKRFIIYLTPDEVDTLPAEPPNILGHSIVRELWKRLKAHKMRLYNWGRNENGAWAEGVKKG